MMTAYEETIPGVGRFALTPVDPATHTDLLYDFVTRPHTRFWGMSDYPREKVREVYEFLDSLDTHHAYLMLLDERPIGIFQTYQPEHDPVGERYEVRDGDIGMHVLFAERGLASVFGPSLAEFLLADPTRQRIVVEPDVRNDAALRRLQTWGFTLANEIDMPDKRAQLAFLTRAQFEALLEAMQATA